MRRWLLVGCVCVACSEPTYVPKKLPPLVAPKPIGELAELSVPQLGFSVGERFLYMVRVRGFTIGNAEIVVRDGEIASTFATSMLAGAVARVEHDLTTTLEGARPAVASERLVADGKTRQFTTRYAGTTSHSLHTALGLVRAWATRGAPAGFFHVVVGDQQVRVEVAEPTGGKDWLRVDGKLVGLDIPATFTLWLDRANNVTRIDIRADGEQISADLVH